MVEQPRCSERYTNCLSIIHIYLLKGVDSFHHGIGPSQLASSRYFDLFLYQETFPPFCYCLSTPHPCDYEPLRCTGTTRLVVIANVWQFAAVTRVATTCHHCNSKIQAVWLVNNALINCHVFAATAWHVAADFYPRVTIKCEIFIEFCLNFCCFLNF